MSLKLIFKGREYYSGLKFLFFGLIILLFSIVLITGCKSNSQDIPQPPVQQEKTAKINVYFSDKQAEKLIAENRELKYVNKTTLPELVIEELIKGPKNPDLSKTIPEGTVLLSLKVEGDVATVDFSKEFRDNHWGGSAGEIMTIYSVVNTLTELEGIDRVKFILEGKELESLKGHLDLTKPLSPDNQLTGS
ncbi:MAG: GerMN domain-containing protein [Peptococcaceae bacterium]|nr:GerMN domain-containing protein [Peptococcaceae bacterium]